MQLDLLERLQKKSKQSSGQKILLALKRSGRHGLYNYELYKIGGLSWHRRLGDLRSEGNEIETIRIKKGVFKYVLRAKQTN